MKRYLMLFMLIVLRPFVVFISKRQRQTQLKSALQKATSERSRLEILTNFNGYLTKR